MGTNIRVKLNDSEIEELKNLRGEKFKENGSRLYRLTPDECSVLGISPISGKKGRKRTDLMSGEEDVEHAKGKEIEKRIESADGIEMYYVGGKPLQSREDAIEHFQIDTEKFTIDRFECKSWPTSMKVKKPGKSQGFQVVQIQNYSVSLKLLRKANEIAWKNLEYTPRETPTRDDWKLGWGICPLADFHAGAFVADLQRTQDYHLGILTGYLEDIAEEINSKKYKKVYMPLLGDFIESFTGLNHINSWKGLDRNSYGMNAVIMTHELLSQHLFSKIENLAIVDFVPGNHDRVTSNNKEDQYGEIAYALQYLFKKDFPNIESQVFSICSQRKIDNIGVLGIHGHLNMAKKDTGKIVQDYGFGKEVEYHILLQGHNHSRETVKTLKKKIAYYEDIVVVQHDSLDYRRITLSPLFTGNLYSEQQGFSSTAGMCHLYKDKRSRLRHEDVTL